MSLEYERTSLWLSSLADAQDGRNGDRHRLRTEYIGFRSRVGTLLEQIRADFPDLTVHDLTHIDELWRIASLLAGESYYINPLEAFVLGGAFLLHDAALCFEAHEGGQAGLRSTVAWKDSFAAESNRSDLRIENDRQKRADFSSVRLLHADQAAKMVDHNWNKSGKGDPLYLVSDPHIRLHLGPLMGSIAASHHRSIEDVATQFSSPVNSPGEFPSEWQIDGVKLACLLRCADALHLDNKRAPDFLCALRQRSGVSHDHWQAQNWLGRPALDPLCPKKETALVTSTRPFPITEANSWWVAYDALSVADKEIKSVNKLIEARGSALCKPLQIKQVRGCDRPESMMEVVKTLGWTPCSASLHVSNIEALVTSLGGEKLYGANCQVGVALRELIQNARDAVCARREIEPGYEGEIFISYNPETKVLTIEDDGIGMSERVLTGPLLSFGTSFWGSDLVRSEFPGLASSKFKSSGRFGIGFFSIFMAAESVSVSSRRYDSGYAETSTLSFPEGLTFRPILSRGRIDGFRRSTQVSLKVKSDLMAESQDLMHGKGFVEANDKGVLSGKKMSLAQYLGSLCASIDVCVSFSIGVEKPERIHSKLPSNPKEYESWLRRMLFADVLQNPEVDQYLRTHAERLRPISRDGRQIGLAAISTVDRTSGWLPLGRHTANYLPKDVLDGSGPWILGFIETGTDSASRGPKPLHDLSPELNGWAREQYTLLSVLPMNETERFLASSGLASFKIDCRPLARLLIFINGTARLCGFEEIVSILQKMPIAIYKSRYGDFFEGYCSFTEFPDAALLRTMGTGWNSLEFNGDGSPASNFSIIDFIQRTAKERGLNVNWEIRKNVRPMDVMGSVDAVVATCVGDIKK